MKWGKKYIIIKFDEAIGSVLEQEANRHEMSEEEYVKYLIAKEVARNDKDSEAHAY